MCGRRCLAFSVGSVASWSPCPESMPCRRTTSWRSGRSPAFSRWRRRPSTLRPGGGSYRRSRFAASSASAAGALADGSNGSRTRGPRRLPEEASNGQRAFGDGEEAGETRAWECRRRPRHRRRRRRRHRDGDGRSGRTRCRGQYGGRSRRLRPRLHLRHEGAQGDPPGSWCASGSPGPCSTNTGSPWTTWRRIFRSKSEAVGGGWISRSSPRARRTPPRTSSASWSAARNRSRASAAR